VSLRYKELIMSLQVLERNKSSNRFCNSLQRNLVLAEDKKSQIKEAIRQLHAGVPPEQVKEKFRAVFEGTDSLEIAKIEEELAKEGMKREEMRKLCDVHMAIFKEQIEKANPDLKPTQPINILMEEHKIMTDMAQQLMSYANKILKVNDVRYVESDIHEVEHLAGDFSDSEKHYLREENVLFPMLEKHGITEPPSIMWMEHDQIREFKKNLQALIKDFKSENFAVFKQELWDVARELGNLLPSHFYKENNILFPAALSVITEPEWVDIRKEFDAIGYCCFTPPELIVPLKEATAVQAPQVAGITQFDFGSLSQTQLNSLLNTLPVEITFVDENDTVQYFNKPEKMIFVRAKSVIGRKVVNCHPQKSLDKVITIVESFKSGKKNFAEFWINLNGRMLHIRFFAVRDAEGKYLGTVEVVQDVTEIMKLQGEKRLLD
jgi:PAS domain S-box-containing protein